MFGMKCQPKKRCGICLNCETGTGYGTPVCYKIQQHNGKPVAVAVGLNDKRADRCYNFKTGEVSA